MTTLRKWIKCVIEAIVPSQKNYAWDEYKKYRALELASARQLRAEQEAYPKYPSL